MGGKCACACGVLVLGAVDQIKWLHEYKFCWNTWRTFQYKRKERDTDARVLGHLGGSTAPTLWGPWKRPG